MLDYFVASLFRVKLVKLAQFDVALFNFYTILTLHYLMLHYLMLNYFNVPIFAVALLVATLGISCCYTI